MDTSPNGAHTLEVEHARQSTAPLKMTPVATLLFTYNMSDNFLQKVPVLPGPRYSGVWLRFIRVSADLRHGALNKHT
jgi:hypothetical protein